MIFHHKGDQSKIRLLICKLETKWHDRYKDNILSKLTTFTKAMKPLNEVLREKLFIYLLFDSNVSLKKDDDYVTFAVHVSRQFQKFKLNSLTEIQFQCLFFITGLIFYSCLRSQSASLKT